MTWDKLATLSPEVVRKQGLFPYPSLPHPKHSPGGQVFPRMQTAMFPRLKRFDVEFDLPEAFLPEFPPAPKLNVLGRLDPSKATESEMRGEKLTLEDTAEFFNLVLELQLTKEEKADLVAFLRTLQPVAACGLANETC
jgi:hypothetical protein